jgi:hypothetical protein
MWVPLVAGATGGTRCGGTDRRDDDERLHPRRRACGFASRGRKLRDTGTVTASGRRRGTQSAPDETGERSGP